MPTIPIWKLKGKLGEAGNLYSFHPARVTSSTVKSLPRRKQSQGLETLGLDMDFVSA